MFFQHLITSLKKCFLFLVAENQKAGFVLTDIEPDESLKDYNDNVVMIKNQQINGLY